MRFNVGMTLFVVALFILLTPGVVVSLPSRGTLLQKAAVHGVLFAVIYHFTNKVVLNFLTEEGFARKESSAHARAREADQKAWRKFKKTNKPEDKAIWEAAKAKLAKTK